MEASFDGWEPNITNLKDYKAKAESDWPGAEYPNIVQENVEGIGQFCKNLGSSRLCDMDGLVCVPKPPQHLAWSQTMTAILVIYFVKEAFKALMVLLFVVRGGPVPVAWRSVFKTSPVCFLLIVRGQIVDVVRHKDSWRDHAWILLFDGVLEAFPMTFLNLVYVFLLMNDGLSQSGWIFLCINLSSSLRLPLNVLVGYVWADGESTQSSVRDPSVQVAPLSHTVQLPGTMSARASSADVVVQGQAAH